MVDGVCKLCGAFGELKLSHFIPKFVGKWVKETSATGFIRLSRDVNKRAQDIAKEYWLCDACEQLFSGWERQFANRVFYPFVNHEADSVIYGNWLAKFCASLSWRTLSYMRHLSPEAHPDWTQSMDDAQAALASFLLGNVGNPGIYEQHLYPLDPIDSASVDIPVNINRYFLRSMHMDVLVSNNELLIYTKLPKFIILGLAGHKQAREMRASRVAISEGRISPGTYQWPVGFAEYLFAKARKVSEMYKEINPAQQALIEKTLIKAPDRAANSRTLTAFQYDLDMFGSRVFVDHDKKETN